MKKLISASLAAVLISTQILTVSAYAQETEPQTSTINSFAQVKPEAAELVKEKELLDIVSSVDSAENKKFLSDYENYEESMKNAKTVDEVIELRKSMDKYVVSQEITYPAKESSKGLVAAVSPGDTRINSRDYTTASHNFSNAQSTSLQIIAYNLLAIAIGWFQPVIGVFLSLTGLTMSEPDYSTVTGLIISNVHIYNYTDKYVEVYRYDSANNNYRWEPMATSQYRQTKSVVTLAQWKKNNVSQPAKVKDVGIVRTEQGNFYYDNTQLVSLAKNTTYPLFYGYGTGPAYDFQPNVW